MILHADFIVIAISSSTLLKSNLLCCNSLICWGIEDIHLMLMAHPVYKLSQEESRYIFQNKKYIYILIIFVQYTKCHKNVSLHVTHILCNETNAPLEARAGCLRRAFWVIFTSRRLCAFCMSFKTRNAINACNLQIGSKCYLSSSLLSFVNTNFNRAHFGLHACFFLRRVQWPLIRFHFISRRPSTPIDFL